MVQLAQGDGEFVAGTDAGKLEVDALTGLALGDSQAQVVAALHGFTVSFEDDVAFFQAGCQCR